MFKESDSKKKGNNPLELSYDDEDSFYNNEENKDQGLDATKQEKVDNMIQLAEQCLHIIQEEQENVKKRNKQLVDIRASVKRGDLDVIDWIKQKRGRKKSFDLATRASTLSSENQMKIQELRNPSSPMFCGKPRPRKVVEEMESSSESESIDIPLVTSVRETKMPSKTAWMIARKKRYHHLTPYQQKKKFA